MKCLKKNGGFTLIEIIAVIIIIGILALVTVPAVSRYVNSTRNKTYTAYEENMEVAANNKVTACVGGNDKNCKLPDKGEKKIYYLHELVEDGFIDELKDPESNISDKFCDNMKSYIEVANHGSADYEFYACLYCENYETEDDRCQKYESDGDAPICGSEVIGASRVWTNKDRTITVKCSDNSSGCTAEEFTKTFRNTVTDGIITISDKSGNIAECPVNAYVDKDKPTCELTVISGNLENEGSSNEWYSGDVKVQLNNLSDADSKVLTYGIGTSINNRNYDKETVLTLKEGLTTVIGYVKDYAGNEGVCSLDVKVGAPKPEFDMEYGYQIYPEKESYTLQNATESGTVITSTTTDPRIVFTGLSKYQNVKRVIVHLNSEITQTNEKAEVYDSSGTLLGTIILPTGVKKFEIDITDGTYDSIRIDIGQTSGVSYDISKIELYLGQANTSGLYTNKDVSVKIIPKNEVVKTTEYSFDNGTTWQTSDTKVFTTNYTNSAVTKNIATLVSTPTTISIQNIDKEDPTCTLKVASGSLASGGYYYTNVTVGFDKTEDSGTSGVDSYGIGNYTTKTATLSEDKTQSYTGNIKDKAGNTATCSISIKRLTSYTLTYNSNGGNACSPTTKTITYNSTYGTLCTPTRTGYTFAGWYTAASGGTQISSTTTVSATADQTLYAHWTANQYTVTLNPNGGSVSPTTTTVTYDSTYGTLPTPTRSGYTFLGWYTTASGGTKITSSTKVTITAAQTLYAQWQGNSLATRIKGDNSYSALNNVTACGGTGGLYTTTNTNGGTTYYYRGNVTNNYVKFAGKTWRIIRINEDGNSVRMILNTSIGTSQFHSNWEYRAGMYYSNSAARTTVNNWYNNNLSSYQSTYLVSTAFCQKAKVTKYYSSDRLGFHSAFFHATSDSYTMTPCYSQYGSWCLTTTSGTYYTITHNCSGNDVSGYGTISGYIGLPTFEDIVFSGAIAEAGCGTSSSYMAKLGTSSEFWTMSPSGVGPHDMINYRHAFVWKYDPSEGKISHELINTSLSLVPVINIKSSVIVTGSGTSGDPYVVQ